jgi:hypothetical protein
MKERNRVSSVRRTYEAFVVRLSLWGFILLFFIHFFFRCSFPILPVSIQSCSTFYPFLACIIHTQKLKE